MSTMRGYLRSDGRKGIRNTVAVAYLVECAHHVAREIALPWREEGVHAIGFPGLFSAFAIVSALAAITIGQVPRAFVADAIKLDKLLQAA